MRVKWNSVEDPKPSKTFESADDWKTTKILDFKPLQGTVEVNRPFYLIASVFVFFFDS